MKIKLLPIFALIFSIQAYSINVTIIESKSTYSWAVQDTVWRHVAVGMGYQATIVPQSTLDDILNLASTDVLIVSSAASSFVSTNHLQTIIKYVKSGRPAYIQSEYLNTYQGDSTFNSVMQAVGANFSWTATVNGQLTPMNILGSFATTPNNVPTLGYFNYGRAGTGTGVEKFLEYQGAYFGFCYTDPNSVNGIVITISDEDWAWQNKSPLLMENILYRLKTPSSATSVNNIKVDDYTLLQVCPNPFSFETNITAAHYFNDVTFIIANSLGQQVKQVNHFSGQTFTLSRENLSSGLYFIYLKQGNKLITTDKLIITDK